MMSEADEIGAGLASPLPGLAHFELARTVEEVREANRLTLPRGRELVGHLKTCARIRGSEEFEEDVKAYLQSDWRMDMLDRLVLKMLLQAEVGAYLQMQVTPDILDEKRRSTQGKLKEFLKKLVFNAILKILTICTLCFGALFAFGFYAPDHDIQVLLWIAITLAVVFSLWIMLSLHYYMFEYPKEKNIVDVRRRPRHPCPL
jgi:hypothetical protein